MSDHQAGNSAQESGGSSEASVQGRSFPAIGDYAFVSDGHSVALISKDASIDWCCLPRVDRESCFGRILDLDRGGHFQIRPREPYEVSRRYVGNSLVLESTFEVGSGAIRVVDAITMREGGREDQSCMLVRRVEGLRGAVETDIEVSPRFEYGELAPWIRRYEPGLFGLIGGDLGLVLESDADLEATGPHDLAATVVVEEGERLHLAIRSVSPERLHPGCPDRTASDRIDEALGKTLEWWETWADGLRDARADLDPSVLRSALVLRGLTYPPSGAILAAPTTSLPEEIGGERNWDYRYSWVRDSAFAVQSLLELGCEREAHRFRYFLERATAGDPAELQVMYSVSGNHRIPEIEIDGLDGYRGSRPVRIGNAAQQQLQLDVYGELLETSWRACRNGDRPTADYWEFLRSVVALVAERWREPDHGIWEVRGEPRHFVHSKAMCWSAVDRALRLSRATGLPGAREDWEALCDEIRGVVEDRGYDRERGVFTRAFDDAGLDASLLLLPCFGFLAYDDERMIRTTDAIREELGSDSGLIRRYDGSDGLSGSEGTFLPCTFWLAECLARQGREPEARRTFARAVECGNDLGLFSEEFDEAAGEMLGNFPQALTHYAHIAAWLALRAGAEGESQ